MNRNNKTTIRVLSGMMGVAVLASAQQTQRPVFKNLITESAIIFVAEIVDVQPRACANDQCATAVRVFAGEILKGPLGGIGVREFVASLQQTTPTFASRTTSLWSNREIRRGQRYLVFGPQPDPRDAFVGPFDLGLITDSQDDVADVRLILTFDSMPAGYQARAMGSALRSSPVRHGRFLAAYAADLLCFGTLLDPDWRSRESSEITAVETSGIEADLVNRRNSTFSSSGLAAIISRLGDNLMARTLPAASAYPMDPGPQVHNRRATRHAAIAAPVVPDRIFKVFANLIADCVTRIGPESEKAALAVSTKSLSDIADVYVPWALKNERARTALETALASGTREVLQQRAATLAADTGQPAFRRNYAQELLRVLTPGPSVH